MDNKYGKWEIIRELGSGGQGTVYVAKDTEKTGGTERRLEDIKKSISSLASAQSHETQQEMGKLLVEAISHLTQKEIDPSALGALKVLHTPREAEGYEKAKERMKREVETLSRIDHPNILKILDHNLDEEWFVGEYHPRGPLSLHQLIFKGDMQRALEAFQPMVEGVYELHKAGIIHRDIKPHNIFLSTDNRLVLGDLGIVFFSDPLHTRVTESYENVGSRDWMPGWAMSKRIDDIRPSFDVFSLGKVLWGMLSGRTLFPLWYLHEDEYDLEKMFPRDESIRWARVILDKSVVEKEKDCLLEDAGQLLALVSNVLHAVRRHAQIVCEGVDRRCEVCGIGVYNCIANEDRMKIQNFGLQPAGGPYFKIFICDYCGHAQIFHVPSSKPRAWTLPQTASPLFRVKW